MAETKRTAVRADGRRGLTFRKKLVLTFVSVLVAVLIFTTAMQVKLTLRTLQQDAVEQQELLTQQMAPNVARSLNTFEEQLYSTFSMYGLPDVLRAFNQENTLRTRTDFHNSVNLLVSNYLPYDYARVETVSGEEWDTGRKLSAAEAGRVSARCAQLLQQHSEVTYGDCVWLRDTDGAVYLIRDVYSMSPIHREAKLIVRLKAARLQALNQPENERGYAFLYFTHELQLIAYSGEDEAHTLSLAGTFVDEGFPHGRVELDGESYYAAVDEEDGWYTVCLAPESRLYSTSTALARRTVLLALAALAAGAACIVLFTQQLSRQLVGLTQAMDAVAEGHLDQQAPVLMRDDVGQLAVHFNRMTQQISTLLARVVQEQKLKTDAQFHFLEYKYRSLQTQISPHFIYNALETVNAMAKIDDRPEISEVIQLISRYFRNITINMNQQFIAMEQEIASLQDYAEIHRRIHGGTLTTEFACAPETLRAQIPTMILQPVLENALVHGIQGSTVQSVVRLTVAREGQQLVVAIADNGRGITPEQQRTLLAPGRRDAPKHSGIGLSNVKERLDLIYGGDAALTIDSSEKGTTVTVRLPFSTSVPLDLDTMEEL